VVSLSPLVSVFLEHLFVTGELSLAELECVSAIGHFLISSLSSSLVSFVSLKLVLEVEPVLGSAT